MEAARAPGFKGLSDGPLQNCQAMNKLLLIKVLYPSVPTRALCDYIGMTTSQVYNTVFKMGVKKRPKIRSLTNRELRINSGMASRYQPGHLPWNKGKKMSSETYAKTAPTMFKPGHKPINTREPDANSVRVSKGTAYHYTKVADSNWQLTHRLMWQRAYGPIPKYHVIRFKDGNTLNLDIQNLECIPMGENAIKNSIHRYPADIQKVIRLRGKLNKKIQKHGKKHNE